MKNKLIYGLIAGAAFTFGMTSCDNEEFLTVTQYTMLDGEAMFEKDANAIKGMTGCYDLLHRRGGMNDDPYKYWIFNGLHPTMDSQASGWDKDFMTQGWTPQNSQLKDFWVQSYACASRCNDFLAGLEASENISDGVKKTLKGEALALRGFQFFGLANTFGRVPLLITGENYLNTPVKARAASYEEMWDFVIKDFKEAADLLAWEPFQGQYGRCTKGMALTFLGDAYMWKAYLCPDKADECYKLAYDVFDKVIKEGPYELAPSFTTLYDADEAWPKEAIWQIVLNSGDLWGDWDDSKNAGARGWTGFYFGPTSNGAWGTYQMSWELYDCFENYINDPVYGNAFDKRRDGSMVTASIPYENLPADKAEKWLQRVTPTKKWLRHNGNHLRGYIEGKVQKVDEKTDTILWKYKLDENGNETEEKEYEWVDGWVFDQAKYDEFAWTDEGDNGIYDPLHPIGYNPFNQEFVGWNGFHWASNDPAPTVWSTKHWRNGRGTDWSTGALWLPDHIYFKRFANVLLDQAECCFRLGKTTEGWNYVNLIRQRAFGNLEVGKDLSKFWKHHQKVADYYGDSDGHGDAVDLPLVDPNNQLGARVYPLAFNTETVNVPDAEQYYTQLKNQMGYQSEVWKVAVNNERRKEFSAEPYLRSDMHKSGFLEDHVNTVYPKSNRPQNGPSTIKEWRTARDFDFKMDKMFMPIPEDELLKNPACDQNPGY